MATPGKYCSDDGKVMLLIHEPSSFDQAEEIPRYNATLQIRKFAPNGIYQDEYKLEHDDGFPDTTFKIVKGYEVIRHHFRGGSVPRSSDPCPRHQVTKTFRLEKVLGGKEKDLFKLIRIPGNGDAGGEEQDDDDDDHNLNEKPLVTIFLKLLPPQEENDKKDDHQHTKFQ